MMRCKGHLDRLRENLLVLDEHIANARVMSKRKGKYAPRCNGLRLFETSFNSGMRP